MKKLKKKQKSMILVRSSLTSQTKGQDQKIGNFFQLSGKSGQEEMVGFAIIMIIVGVILLIVLSLSLRSSNKESVESYEVESFIQSLLQYTTDCRDNLEYLSIKKLIFNCEDNDVCLDKRDSCEVLNENLENILKETWKVEGDRPVKGYEFKILVADEEMLLIEEGEITGNSKGAVQDFPRGGKNYFVYFNAYY